MTLDLKKYQKLLELDEGVQFIKIDHADAMVADIYKAAILIELNPI